MSYLQVANNAHSTLAAGISDSDTELTVAAGEGDRFPGSNFPLTIDDEIMKCSSRSGDVFTIVRAQEGTVAAVHDINAAVRLNITRALIDEIHSALDSCPQAHAASHTDGTDDIQNATSGQKGVATAAQIAKLNGIESGATADQTGAEIKTAYEAEADTNAYTDTEKAKLAAIEANATKYPDTGEQAFLDADHAKLDGIEAAADITDAANVGSSIHGAATKAAPVDADTQPLIDSAAGNALKKITWANIRAALKAYFDTLYEALGDLAAHAALDTGVHGAGGDTLATDADVAAHEADIDAHHCFPHQKLKIASYILPFVTGQFDNASLYLYRLHCAAVLVTRTITVDRITVEVDTADVGKYIRLGIYDDNNTVPNNLIVDAGTVDTDSTGIKSIAINRQLTPGIYWIACISDTNDVAQVVGMYSCHTAVGGLLSSFGNGISHTFTNCGAAEFAALPDPHPTPYAYVHYGPLMALRIASLD